VAAAEELGGEHLPRRSEEFGQQRHAEKLVRHCRRCEAKGCFKARGNFRQFSVSTQRRAFFSSSAPGGVRGTYPAALAGSSTEAHVIFIKGVCPTA
jgi:hypothetical protein